MLINKPAGLLSLSGKDPRNLDSVHHRLVQRFPGCTLVHRLDFGTSGLMVIARNKGINALLCQQFSQRTVDKVYTALLCGHLAEDEGIVEAAIAKDPAHFPRMALCARHGKPARSRYRVIDRLYQAREGERALGVNPGDAHPGDRTDPSAAYSLPAAGLSDPWLRSVRWPGAARHGTGSAADAARQRTALCPPRQP
ncbi:putative ribosomal large subunit pseudouridine synthase A [Klebsiella pneumoniae]|nr:putative ribosomal large subunit pseudouridine synthase A [Klebsiella pneumoniae]